ncbi:L-histidine N(alpha)-methyltransferase [Streptomyces mutabilis]|uniref:L-histidine N(alpha)-methyltransferase n=1 Tax=Streptomyces mutabilis TaxID=67332 RepID=UPI000B004B6D|nr:L-histidine N(alpha)-methyltransferase [Streptomyces mutabilis]
MPIFETECFVTPADTEQALRSDVARGLSRMPKEVPPKWFYDEKGSELFDEITRLDEYYPTRCERAILTKYAEDMAKSSGAVTLMELGAGSGDKTRILLDALIGEGTLQSYVPVDVSRDFLLDSAAKIAADYPELRIHAVAADHDRHLALLPDGERRLIAFLGSTIGNMAPQERARFLGGLRGIMGPDNSLLLGIDLVKDRSRLVRAYDDVRGVTAAFNLNLLSVLNRELGADFDPMKFRHVAVWDDVHERIEMRLRSTCDQTVVLRDLGLKIPFAAAEEMRTEISSKFRRPGVQRELAAAGLELAHWWGDLDGDYAVCLARPV